MFKPKIWVHAKNDSKRIHKLQRLTKNNSEYKRKGMVNTDTLINLGIRAGSGVVTKLVENGFNSFANKDNAKVPFISSNQRTQIGTKTATYQSTHTHIGIPTTERLKRIRFNPNVDYDEKLISSSDRDYQSHEKRKNLMLRSGFNEKGYTFFMEDTYFTVDDYLTLYNEGNKISNVLANSHSKTDLYGCVYKTRNKFKFMNKFDFYDVNLRLHLVKLTDQSKDVRELIQGITNNKSSVV